MKIGRKDKKRVEQYIIENSHKTINEIIDEFEFKAKQKLKITKTEALVYYFLTRVYKK